MEIKSSFHPFPSKEYTEPQYFASGTTSSVYKITKISLGEEYVLKVINDKFKKNALAEYKISQQLNCSENKHIICYKHLYQYKDKMAFLIDYIPNFTLTNYINDRLPDENDEKLNFRYLKQIFETVNYIHSKGIVHRDLKPDNILIHNGNIYIIDFGFSASSEVNPETFFSLRGTPRYLSPEMWKNKFSKNISNDIILEILKKSDIYSCGIIAYYLFFNKLPIPTSDKEILKTKTINGEINIPQTTELIHNIISSLLTNDYKKRPNLDTILKMFN
jgi:serine/threonine protein kinase